MLSSQEILERTNIGSSKTLTRWHQKRLIPPPEVRTHPSGRGKMAYWPAWVVLRIKEVKSRLSQGDSLDAIAGEFDGDWQAEEQRWTRKRRNIKRAIENEKRQKARDRFAEIIAERVDQFLKTIGVQRPGVFGRLEDEFSDLALVREAIQLTKDGFNAIAVITGARIFVTTDVTVSKSLAEMDVTPLMIVPLGTAIRESFGEIEELGEG